MLRVAASPIFPVTLCLANTTASVLGSFADNYAAGEWQFAEKAIAGVGPCVAAVVIDRLQCSKGGRFVGATANVVLAAAAGFGFGGNSFPVGTEVMTPDGPMAIEALREGDLVIARHEESGTSGVFPVTATMAHQAPGLLWLTLENSAGETERLGVTAEHPLFAETLGWTHAADLRPGDRVRNSEPLPLTVLAVKVDATPVMVHNLEVAEAHTFFVGELEAWGHNTGPSGPFSIWDWTGYPDNAPKIRKNTVFTPISGEDYAQARREANNANRNLRRSAAKCGSKIPRDVEIHEIIPVRLGGSPANPANKFIVGRDLHTAITNFFRGFH